MRDEDKNVTINGQECEKIMVDIWDDVLEQSVYIWVPTKFKYPSKDKMSKN